MQRCLLLDNARQHLSFLVLIALCAVAAAIWSPGPLLTAAAWLTLFLLYYLHCTAYEQIQHTQIRLETILNHISDAIITIDERGSIRSLNKGVEELFGYVENELLGRNINMLMPEPYCTLHDSYLDAYLKSGAPHIIGRIREVTALRKNGEVFEAVLHVQDINLPEGHRFLGILHDISKLRAMERMKTEFISTVSHELRTPLTSIRGSLSLLKSKSLHDPNKAERMIELAYNNTERLINLVNDLLDVEKLQAGKFELHFEAIPLRPLLQQAIDANQAYASNFRTSLVLLPDTPDVMIYGDKNRLLQVLANLLSNAAKYSSENGIVEIKAEVLLDELVRVSVIDHGQGIPEEYRPKIFQKFSQIDASDSRRKGGTGLGLNITKNIIERLGGHIDYVSQPGAGCTFFFELPIYRPEMQTAPTPMPADVTLAAPVPERLWSNDSATKHILVLEDDPDIAQLLRLLLQQLALRVTICHTAQHAKTLLRADHFDLMTVDLRLPDQDGLALIRELRADERYRALKIIVVSAYTVGLGANDYKALGLNIIDWINKPIDTARLQRAVRQAMEQDRERACILYIEDDPGVVQMLDTLLGDCVTMLHAPNLQSALSFIAQRTFDLVILDIGLPDGTGLDILPLLHHRHPSIPVIIFSGDEMSRTIAEKVNAALVKSRVNNEELLHTIKRLIQLPDASSQS